VPKFARFKQLLPLLFCKWHPYQQPVLTRAILEVNRHARLLFGHVVQARLDDDVCFDGRSVDEMTSRDGRMTGAPPPIMGQPPPNPPPPNPPPTNSPPPPNNCAFRLDPQRTINCSDSLAHDNWQNGQVIQFSPVRPPSLAGHARLPGAHEQKTHLGVGPVLTFPTASNPILGSEQYTAGPGVHFSTEIGRLTAGFFLWQSWGFGEAAGQTTVNQLFGKPFLIYEVSEKWNLVYIPLGMSHSWDAPSGDNWTVPVGGGVRRLFEIRGQKMGLQFQAFDYVARKSKDPEWELRATIEFLFD
jgi:hypothetical protein